ncbi:MAG: serine/threonine protein kinase, partial [Deltaproteobacteria bacterium]|nr:serine/threonine protein kinase [Deltaproteobacteria bacterium]
LPGTLHGDRGALGTVEDAMLQLQQLIAGAERRCSDQVNRRRAEVARRDVLAHAALAAVQASAGAGPTSLHDATMATARAAEATLPAPIALVVTQALNVLANLALDRSSLPPPPPPMRAVKLPDWVPARRIVGGFYVEKPLGGGNVGSVFVVTRSDERHERDAPRFALKVPEYSATIARAMSEADFLRLFREEAGALLAIPEHPNVAGFVTFDAGAKPKPILVMELVKGTSCERILATQTITIPLALRVLDGMLAGLEAMHDVGIAHLDVKPSNVILRAGTGDPVLVDFGLAGRKVRPGCATLCYGAPEIWEATAATASWLPASAADVYAFGCCGYEILTSQTLFDGDTDVAIMTQHVNHDGVPPGIAKLAHRHPRLAEFLAACLRHDPRMRASVKQLRAAMSAVRTELERCSLPLG